MTVARKREITEVAALVDRRVCVNPAEYCKGPCLGRSEQSLTVNDCDSSG